MTTSISVIVAARNAARHLERCLRSLLDQRPPVHEIIVVDDASHDRTAAIARALGVREITLSKRAGPGGARNAGAAVATGDVLAFVDSDSVAEPGWAEGIADRVTAGAEIIAGDIRSGQPRTLAEWFAESRMQDHDLTGRRNGFLPFAVTANLAIRKEIFDELEGFDDALRAWGDADLSFRAQQRGYGITYASEASVRHRRLASLWGLVRQRARNARGAVQLNWKYQRYPFQGVSPYLRLREEALELAMALLVDSRRDRRNLAKPGFLLTLFGATLVGEWLGKLELYGGLRRPPAVLLPGDATTRGAAVSLAKGPAFLLLGEDAVAMRILIRALALAPDIAVAPPTPAAELARRWDEPAPWSLRLVREARTRGLKLPPYITARRLESTRPRSYGEAVLNLHAVNAWLLGKGAYGLAAGGTGGFELARRLPDVPVVLIGEDGGQSHPHTLQLTRHDLFHTGEAVPRLESATGHTLGARVEQLLRINCNALSGMSPLPL